jgi:arylsulfatase A-like enzyme
MLERTMIVVTGDHGEAFGAHGVPYHVISAYEPLVRVPGVVLAPGLAPGRYPHLVSHRDVPATVLGAFGLASEEGAEDFGRSWLRLRDAPLAPLHRFVVSYAAHGGRGFLFVMPLATLVEPERKLIETFENSLYELYDPVADPGEQDDLVVDELDTLGRLHRELSLYRDIDGYL